MKQVIKNFIYNSFYQILNLIVPLITAPYLARVIGAEGVGKYSYAYSIAYYFFIFIKFGLDNYGNRTIAVVRCERKKMSETFWSIYFMQFLFGVLFSVLYIAYIIILAKDKIAASMLMLYVVSGVFDITWFFNGIEKFKLTVTRNVIVKVLATVLIFVFVKNSDDIYIYILIMSLSFLASQILIWPFIKREVDFVKVSISKVILHIKPNLILFMAVLAVSFYRYMDKIMLGSIVSEYEVGLYENAEKLMQIPLNFVNALGIVMIPKMSHAFSCSEKNNKTNGIILLSEVFAVFLASSLCLGIMSVADLLVPIFYGDGYEKCIILLYVLMPSCLFMAFANVIRTQYIIPLKKDNVFIKTIIGGAIVNLIINSLLIPRLAAVGAAIGTLAAEIVVCILQVYSVKKELPISRFVKYSLPFLVAGIIMVVTLDFIPVFVKSGVLALLIKVFVGIVIYVLVSSILVFIYRKKYKEVIRSISK